MKSGTALSTLAAILLLLIPQAGQAEDWDSAVRRGDALYERGQGDAALTAYEAAETVSATDFERAIVALRIIPLLLDMDRSEEALPRVAPAELAVASAFGDLSEAYSTFLAYGFMVYRQVGDTQRAADFQQRGIEISANRKALGWIERADGVAEARLSGALFPAVLGALQRTGLSVFDESGLDVGVTYEGASPNGAIVLSVYVTQGLQISMDDHFDDSLTRIRQRFTDSLVVERDVYRAQTGLGELLGRRALVSLTMDGQKSVSGLYVFEPFRSTHVKFRVTAPAQDLVELAAGVEDMIKAMTWPGAGGPSTGD